MYSGDCVDVFLNSYCVRDPTYFHALTLAAMSLTLLTMAPLPLKGGTSCPVNPIALF